MRVAVDMDEVLYSWERTARYLLRNVYTGSVMGYNLEYPFTKWLIADQVGENAYKWLFNEGVRAGLFRHGHVITGAMLGVRALKEQGHDLIIVTHRPENGVQDTLAWIDFHFGREDPYPWDGVSILSGGEPKSSVAWDVIIDDSPRVIEDAMENGRGAVKFGAHWNGGGATWADIIREGVMR